MNHLRRLWDLLAPLRYIGRTAAMAALVGPALVLWFLLVLAGFQVSGLMAFLHKLSSAYAAAPPESQKEFTSFIQWAFVGLVALKVATDVLSDRREAAWEWLKRQAGKAND